jgi:hypothetical protein
MKFIEKIGNKIETGVGKLKGLSAYLKTLALTGVFLAGFGEAEGQCIATTSKELASEEIENFENQIREIDSLIGVLKTEAEGYGLEIDESDSTLYLNAIDIDQSSYYKSNYSENFEIINKEYIEVRDGKSDTLVVNYIRSDNDLYATSFDKSANIPLRLEHRPMTDHDFIISDRTGDGKPEHNAGGLGNMMIGYAGYNHNFKNFYSSLGKEQKIEEFSEEIDLITRTIRRDIALIREAKGEK